MNDNLKIILAVVVTAVVCIAGSSMVFGGDAEEKTTLTIVGSTTVSPIVTELQKEFEKYANAQVNVSETGSGNGAASVIQKTADIGMMSRDPSQSEIQGGLVANVIGMDAVVIIVSADAGVSNLTLEQIANIYNGIYTNWNEVGGNDLRILPMVREEGSGTRDCIEEALSGAVEGYETSDGFAAHASTGAMKTAVETHIGAIGYVSLGAASELSNNTIAVTVEDVEASTETVLDNSYPIYRSLILATNGEATGMAAFFINWILSPEGQEVVEEMGFVKLVQ